MFEENLDIFLDEVNGFAERAVYTPQDGEPVEILGIFDDEFHEIEIGESGMVGATLSFMAKTSDVPNAASGDTLLYDGVTYTVAYPMKERKGFTDLILNEPDED